MFNLSLANLDLLSVGIAITAIGLLGFLVYFNNRKSSTNKTFLLFSILTIIWGISNYLEYTFKTPTSILWALRFHVFISVLHAFFFFRLCLVFPEEKANLSWWYRFILIPVVSFTAVLTLTPFVFETVLEVAPPGQVTDPVRGWGLILFVFVALGLLLFGLALLFFRLLKSKGIIRRQILFVLLGMLITAFLIVLFNVILPVTFGDLRFIPYAALFLLPLIAFISYTIYKHKLFNLKVATTGVLAFLITAFSFVNIIYSKELSGIVLNITAFVIILIGSIRLIHDMVLLEQANEKLRELDKQKSEFVSFASHQLRSPLTAMKGYSSLLLEGDYGEINPPAREAVQRIYDSTNTLTNVVNDYLDITRIELGTMKYNFANIDLRDLTTQVIAELKPTIEKSGLKLNYDVFHNDHYMVKADKDKLKQVIANLIDNSFKYTPKGSVLVTIERKDSNVRLSIKDTGIGMSAETIPKLFEKFVRASTSNMAEIKGTGLGLFVAKEIVVSHGGRIWAESKGEGKGSEFYVELPIVGGVK